MIEIKHRFTGAVLFCYTPEGTLKDAVMAAVKARADLSGADLRGADLSGAYLRGAYLRGADLSGADLSGEKLFIAPVQVLGLRWDVLISGEFLVVGCQRHKHEEWACFDDETISKMDSDAALFWAENKVILMAMCSTHKAKSLAASKGVTE